MKEDWKIRRDLSLKNTPEGSGEHAWFFYKDDKFESCARCGVIKRKDGKNKPCKGTIKIKLRN